MIFKQILCVLGFMTRIPCPQIQLSDEKFGKSLMFAPVAGAVVGAILCAVYYLISLFGNIYVSAFVVVVTYCIVTGGIQIDGFADCLDGFFSVREREKILVIMKDSRCGTFGVLGIVLLILCYFSFFAAFFGAEDKGLIYSVLLIMPIMGRYASLVSASYGKYARNEGLGKLFCEYCRTGQAVVATIIAAIFLAIAYLISGKYWFCFSIIPVVLTVIAMNFYSNKKIGGVTGDVFGFVCELSQVVFLFVMLNSF